MQVLSNHITSTVNRDSLTVAARAVGVRCPMSRPVLLAFFMFGAQSTIADNCSDRILKEGDLIYPRNHSGLEVLADGQSCTVYLKYGLSSQGKPEGVESYVVRQGCEMFENSAKKAIMKTKFGLGVPESGCEYEYTFEFED